MNFDAAFDILVDPQHEGGYSNDPADPGQETMWGVTIRIARANGYTGAMRDLPRDAAKSIARSAYWVPAHCDDAPDPVRFDLFDTAYNTGVHEAIVLLQRAAGLPDDGYFGPATLASMRAIDGEQLRRVFCGHRLLFYAQCQGWAHDGRGWTVRVATNLIRTQ